jgi:hypothetical protein
MKSSQEAYENRVGRVSSVLSTLKYLQVHLPQRGCAVARRTHGWNRMHPHHTKSVVCAACKATPAGKAPTNRTNQPRTCACRKLPSGTPSTSPTRRMHRTPWRCSGMQQPARLCGRQTPSGPSWKRRRHSPGSRNACASSPTPPPSTACRARAPRAQTKLVRVHMYQHTHATQALPICYHGTSNQDEHGGCAQRLLGSTSCAAPTVLPMGNSRAMGQTPA